MPTTSKGDTAPPDPKQNEPESPAAYEYTAGFDTVYLSVPLTARQARDDAPATVFAWPGGPPEDGRWQPTRKKPNQAPDNEPAPNTEEE